METAKVVCVPAGALRANSYLVTADGASAVLIDCGGEEPLAEAERRGLRVAAVLLTHGHFDHIGGCAAAKRRGIPVGCAAAEERLIAAQPAFAAQLGLRVPPFAPDFTFSGGDSLAYGGLTFRVLATPGHTPGGVCYYVESEGVLFSGDTLFQNSVGRTDFPNSSTSDLIRSLREKVMQLPDDVKVYPGHMGETTIGHERKNNQFI